jgi:hypothetical protein
VTSVTKPRGNAEYMSGAAGCVICETAIAIALSPFHGRVPLASS